MSGQTSGSYTIILRMELEPNVAFIQIANAIHEKGGEIVAVDIVNRSKQKTIRDITVSVSNRETEAELIENVRNVPGIKIVNISDRTFLMHLGGKLEVRSKVPIKNRDDLSHVYTPGVARVCMALHEDPSKAYSLTIKRNTVAVVSDGTAVLGLGDIGPIAAMPVMEGKAMLFKEMADIDSFPICLDTKDTEEIIRIVKSIAPAFGGINLEDISSPRCFEIEERLKKELDIPVFHDDQHGTAVVMLAGLINALKIVNKQISDIKVVFSGVGAAGVACTKMLIAAGVKHIVGATRSVGIINRNATYENPMLQWYAENTNPDNVTGTLSDAMQGADVFIGLSGPGVITVDDLKKMAKDPIVFAMANPTPEILPEIAEPYVRVMATGRSDYPNQLNNVLCFPGIFRGALDCQATIINEEMKLAAAYAIASIVEDAELNEQYIIPSVFNNRVVEVVRRKVIQAAVDTGVARKVPHEFA
ncbi:MULTISPECIES: NAD-dependent malic enzyme [Paenibacillus]|uniref:Malate dehydrogenase n=1 Tax=Paenibacillus naphthalenovorans TaxID=162209 RepID=A0A0U2VKB6_9BACL|nr:MULTISPECIES: NAD-dependent malic enzyme [Paenibacillus]ALS21238.1 malate dehydrogenase [Paenibacillus naphthalenovorans]GCL72496.1 NAD-dependent malic enzyme [Paenibacillus naphthalenovorans]SDH99304.1 malate dehydrogenase (oxaloacetate-decarboxylating) [Paenibacillus naphthalenovorans]